MATRPKDYDSITVGGESLNAGGHRCVIKQVDETKTSDGKDMLVFYLDTATDDSQPQYFTNKYMANQQENKKWPNNGIYRLIQQSDYYGRNIKRLITAIEDSNKGFSEKSMDWNNLHAALKNKLVGCVFRSTEHEYNGRQWWSADPMYFRKVDGIENEPVPDEKPLETKTCFAPVSDEEGLPFR